jgi:predicted acylesterase/phospholipase RssA
MRKRLAITISGAVSLGSYEAGVMYEIVRALREHNENAQTTEDQKIEIDVFTGASAGGMTAAIAAQKLLFEADAFRSESDNPFFNPWVRDVDLLGLLQLSGDDNPAKSIFSTQFVETVSKKYLTNRYQSVPLPPPVQHPAASRRLRIGLAISNLNGIDYNVIPPPGQPNAAGFLYTRFQDEFVRPLTPDATLEDRLDVWEPIRQAAVACGAFPFAFRVQELQRTAGEYAPNAAFPNPDLRFAYTDGGVFQNEPLGLAKNFVDEIDGHQNTESRFYLFVSPHAKASVMNRTFTADGAKLWPAALQLIAGIFNESQYQDWARADEINAHIYLFNDRATGLQKALLKPGSIGVAELKQTAASLLKLLFPSDVNDALKNGERSRLKGQFAREYNELKQAKGGDTADVWIDSILVLEKSANLGSRDEMTIYTITATNDTVAGELLYSFGGFFSEKIRQYDYDRGRLNARKFLRQHANASGPNEIGPLHFNDSPDPVLDAKPGNMGVGDLDEDLRQQVRDRLYDRLDDMMQAAGMSGLVRWAVKTFYLSSKLNQIFKL